MTIREYELCQYFYRKYGIKIGELNYDFHWSEGLNVYKQN